jgi:hypothetical protein
MTSRCATARLADDVWSLGVLAFQLATCSATPWPAIDAVVASSGGAAIL